MFKNTCPCCYDIELPATIPPTYPYNNDGTIKKVGTSMIKSITPILFNRSLKLYDGGIGVTVNPIRIAVVLEKYRVVQRMKRNKLRSGFNICEQESEKQ
jgi:hypothetical protein